MTSAKISITIINVNTTQQPLKIDDRAAQRAVNASAIKNIWTMRVQSKELHKSVQSAARCEVRAQYEKLCDIDNNQCQKQVKNHTTMSTGLRAARPSFSTKKPYDNINNEFENQAKNYSRVIGVMRSAIRTPLPKKQNKSNNNECPKHVNNYTQVSTRLPSMMPSPVRWKVKSQS